MKREQERQELLTGIVAANIVNFSMGRPEQAVSPEDFMPSRAEKKQTQRRQTAEEMLGVIQQIHAMRAGQRKQSGN